MDALPCTIVVAHKYDNGSYMHAENILVIIIEERSVERIERLAVQRRLTESACSIRLAKVPVKKKYKRSIDTQLV